MIDDRCLFTRWRDQIKPCSFFDLPLQNCVKLAGPEGPLLSTFWKSMDCLNLSIL